MLEPANWIEKVKWNSDGLVPVVAQQHATGDVLMLAWMNREALLETQKTGYAVYWSRSRKELWSKGATSGHRQKIKAIFLDCDSDAILILVDQEGDIACHTGRHSCFFQKLIDQYSNNSLGEPFWNSDVIEKITEEGLCSNQQIVSESILSRLSKTIESRKKSSPEQSYVSSLMAKGENSVLKKVGEEASEVVMAAKDYSKKQSDDAYRKALIGEMADLWFHCLVTLSYYALSPDDILKELKRRDGLSGLKEKASRKLR